MKIQITCAVLGLILAGCVSTTNQLTTKDDEAAAAYNLQLAIDYFQQNNLSLAKEKLDRSLQQNSRDPQAFVVAGLLYDRLNEGRKAEQYFDKAVSLDPKNAETQNSFAAFLCRRGQYSKGEQAAVNAATNPLYKTPEAGWLNAGNCALDAKNNDKAENYYRRALAVRPNFEPALLQMADIEFNSGNLLSARAFLERLLQAAKPTPATLWLGVRIERSAGNTSPAADYARRLREQYPTSAETKALLESEQKKP